MSKKNLSPGANFSKCLRKPLAYLSSLTPNSKTCSFTLTPTSYLLKPPSLLTNSFCNNPTLNLTQKPIPITPNFSKIYRT